MTKEVRGQTAELSVSFLSVALIASEQESEANERFDEQARSCETDITAIAHRERLQGLDTPPHPLLSHFERHMFGSSLADGGPGAIVPDKLLCILL